MSTNVEVMSLNEVNRQFESFLETLDPSIDKNKLEKAYDFAKKAHKFQRRQSGEPYILHPLEVTKIVNSFGLDEAALIAAFLHDTVEDTDVSLDQIKKEFGEEVATLVGSLTKIHRVGNSRKEKNIEALRKVLLASAKDIRVLIIKLCDRLHNMRTLGEVSEEKRVRVSQETLDIYAPIAQKTGLYALKWEFEDLAFKHINPEMYQFIKQKINLKRSEREKIVQKSVEEIKSFLDKNSVSYISVLGRPKNFFSIYKKIKDKAKTFDEIYDLYAVRIITKDIGECYSILGTVHENFTVFPNRLKDYIANPKANGYQAIHTVVFSPAINTPIEIQIRTEEMNRLAEFGIAAHWKYKNVQEDKKFEKKISWLREIIQWEKEHPHNEDFLDLIKCDFFEDEIFVFTPQNEVVILPEGATVLDFAYAVHTEIGSRTLKAKINGSVSTIDQELYSGDIIEIITKSNVRPSEKWLKFVKTQKARLKIRAALNLKHLSGKQKKNSESVTFEVLKEKLSGVEKFKKIRKAGCCDFTYGTQIVAIETKNKECVIHNASCDNAKYSINKKFPVSWKEDKKKEILIEMTLKDRYGLLIDVLNVLSEYNISVSKLNTKVNKDGSVILSISMVDGPYIESLIKKLKKVETVGSVRVIRGLFDRLK